MAGLRFAVLLAAFSYGVLLLAASASASAPASRSPAVYDAGDEWRAAPASNDGAHMTLIMWAMTHRFYVGDVLDFKRSNDTILLVRQRDYERCSAASPGRRFADGGVDTRLTLGHLGLFYFISGLPARCEAGQRMVLRVVDDRPIPVWLKLLTPALLGFLGGYLLAGLIIWRCGSRARIFPIETRGH